MPANAATEAFDEIVYNARGALKKRDWPRYLKALKLRQSGLTLSEVGERLGISKERARQMIYTANRRAELDKGWNGEWN